MGTMNNQIKQFINDAAKIYLSYEKTGSNVTFSCEGELTCYFNHSHIYSFGIDNSTVVVSNVKSVKIHENTLKIRCLDDSKIILKKI